MVFRRTGVEAERAWQPNSLPVATLLAKGGMSFAKFASDGRGKSINCVILSSSTFCRFQSTSIIRRFRMSFQARAVRGADKQDSRTDDVGTSYITQFS
jgi:hypothetical protein